MKLTTGIQREMGMLTLGETPPIPTTLEGMVDALGGSREAARALGLPLDTQQHINNSMRDVQRYVNREKYGKTPNNRLISAENRQKLHQATVDKLFAKPLNEIKQRGLKVIMRDVEVLDPSGYPVGTRDIDTVIDGAALDAFLEAYVASFYGAFSLDETAERFNEAVFDSRDYSFPGATIDPSGNAVPPNGFAIRLA